MTVADLPSPSSVHAQEQQVTATRDATGTAPPERPADLQASASHDSVTLTWTASTDDTVTHYAVLRRDRNADDAGVFEVIESNAGPGASYTDDSVSPEGSYVYRVKAVSPTGVSQWSSYARADTPAAPTPTPEPTPDPEDLAPSGLSAKVVSGDDGVIEGVALAWDAPAEDAASVTGYEVLRAVGDRDMATLVADTGSADTTHTDDTATEAGERYAYRVKALRGEEASQPSDRAVAIIPKTTPGELEPLVAARQNAADTEVPANWSLIPSDLDVGGRFRLIFISSTTRNGSSKNIADYNTFVQNATAAGHADVQGHSSTFRVVGSTTGEDARDNTSTTYDADDKGVPIYWLGGNKVADQYQDFYDGGWDDEANAKDEFGNDRSTTGESNYPITGSEYDGTADAGFSGPQVLGATFWVTTGRLNDSGARSSPLQSDTLAAPTASRPMYGLSGVFVVSSQGKTGEAPAFALDAYTRGVAENSDGGVNVGDPVTATDGDGDTLTYRLEGADAASFSIDSASGQIQTKSGVVYDFEGTSSYAVTVRADDGNGGRVTIAVTINLTDVDEPPTAPGAPTAFLLSGATDTLSVSWTPPDNTGKPDIESYDLRYRKGSSGDWTDGPQNVTLTSATITGLDADSSYQVQVQATSDEGESPWSASGYGSTSTQFDVLVSNVGAGVLTTKRVDLDGWAQSFDTGSNTEGYDFKSILLWISGLEVHPGTTTASLRKDDGGSPSDTALYTLTVPATQVEAALNAFTAPDGASLDANTTYWFVIRYVNDGQPNAIFGGWHFHKVRLAVGLDPGAAPGWNIDAPAQAEGLSPSFGTEWAAPDENGAIKIQVLGRPKGEADANNLPAFPAETATRTVPENSPPETNVGAAVSATDADTGATLTYNLEGNHGASFDIDAASRQIKTKAGVTYDYEARSSYLVTVKVRDGNEGADTIAVTINLTDLNEPPAAPGAPTVTGVDGSGDSLSVSWVEPDTTGIPSDLTYDLQYRKTGITGWTDGPQDETGTSATITGLDAVSEYQVQVLATNDEGDSPWSASGAGSTQAEPVPANWGLIPSGLDGGDRFRLVFITSGTRDGSSTDIADYNTFVQEAAAAGHADIRDYSSTFRVVGSTADVDARDNTYTTHTADNAGVAIYWLGGAKVADDYAGFYDGEWDDEANARDESGNVRSTSGSADWPFTGSTHDGIESFNFANHSKALGANLVRVGQPNDASGGPLSSDETPGQANSRPFYGLSAVFVVQPNAAPAFTSEDNFSVEENQTAAGTVAATDPDAVDTVTYAVTGGADQAHFRIGADSGVLIFASAPDHESPADAGTNNVYQVTVTATGGTGNRALTATQDITVTVTDVDETPEVDSVDVTSTPSATADTYGAGETIKVTVTFDQAVTVTGTPHIRLRVGGGQQEHFRWADYAGGTGTMALVFAYVVQSFDMDDNGVYIQRNELFLSNGTIQGVDDDVAANLDYATKGTQSGHEVDGSLSTTNSASTDTEVPADWGLIPGDLMPGDRFRLIFISLNKRDGSSTDIDVYNTFVQTAAAGGHTDIRDHSSTFRAVGSTAAVDARDNTDTRYTGDETVATNDDSDLGVAIYWLGGAKVADDYKDFYDEDWDDEDNAKDQSGADRNTTSIANWPITGSEHDGTERVHQGTSRALGADDVQVGRLHSTGGGPLNSVTTAPKGDSRTLYGLSGVFVVGAASTDATLSALSLSGVTLSSSFAADTLAYTASVDTAVDSTTVTATANDDGAAVVILPADADDATDGHQVELAVGDTTVSVTVTAADGTTTQTYTATVTRAAPPAPIIGDVTVSSLPGADQTYAIGDAIQVTVIFDAAVTVTGTPRIQLRVGGGDPQHLKWADYASGTGNEALVFAYTVQAGDEDTNGIFIAENELELNGGTIQSAGGTDAILAYTGPGTQSGHKVDGVRPTPLLAATSDDGASIIILFSEPLAATTAPASAFTLAVDTGTAPAVSSATASGDRVTLALASALTSDQAATVTVSYADPAGDDSAAVQDPAGNDAAGFTTGSAEVPDVANAIGAGCSIADGCYVVPAEWSLIPDSLDAGDRFRLLFLSSTTRNARSTDIDVYNTWIQDRAAAGHTDIQDYSSIFRVVGSTAAVDARDNTATRYTGDDTAATDDDSDLGVAIYWLDGNKVADDYKGFYDGDWDDEENAKDESGSGHDTSAGIDGPFTGSNHDGTESFSGQGSSRALGANSVQVGQPNSSAGPLSSGTGVSSGTSRSLYGLSAVFRVEGQTTTTNTAPMFDVSRHEVSRDENQPANKLVVSLVEVTDADNDTLTFSIEGDDAASFRVDSSSGQVRTIPGVTYDYEAQSVYTFTLRVEDGNGGTDTLAVTVNLNDVDEPPAAPAAPAVSPVADSTTSLSVTWTAPDNTGKPDIESYDLQYRQGTSSWTDGPQDVTEDGTDPEAIITGLDAGTEYQVQVRATNDEGDSLWSAAGSGSTNAPAVMPADTVVPADWGLIPSGLGVGDRFRLIFVSSGTRDAQPTNIADYNTFVQNAAAAGHTDIQGHSSTFRVVGSTEAVDARDNTATRYTGDDTAATDDDSDLGVAIYWLGGAKVADQYKDFYDGGWDDEANAKDESGNDRSTAGTSNAPLTGSDHDGTEAFTDTTSNALGTINARRGWLNSPVPGAGPLNSLSTTDVNNPRPLYGLSGVFVVEDTASTVTEIWSTTLTVKEISPGFAYGCNNEVSGKECSTHLDDDRFTYNGNGYQFNALLFGSGELTLVFPRAPGDDLNSFELNADGNIFSFQNATMVTSKLFIISLPGFSPWPADTEVSLSITANVETNVAPTFPFDVGTREVLENSPAGTNVGLPVTATDANNDTLTYTLEGIDADSFQIDSTTGQIQTKSGVTYNHEGKSSYLVAVKADDGNGGTHTITVTINLIDVTPPSALDAPIVSPVTGSSDSLEVTWTAPDTDIRSYDLQYRQGTTGDWTDGPQDETGLSATITGLDAGTEYQVQVRATNDEGDGDWSASGSGTTNAQAVTLAIILSLDVDSNVTVDSRGLVKVSEDYGVLRIGLRAEANVQPTEDFEVTLNLVDVSTIVGSDYRWPSSTFAFSAAGFMLDGGRYVLTVSNDLEVIDDDIVERHQFADLEIDDTTLPSYVTAGGDFPTVNDHAVTILNDDEATVSMMDLVMNEGEQAEARLLVSHQVEFAFTVVLRILDNQSHQSLDEFEKIGLAAKFESLAGEATTTVESKDNSRFESDQTFEVELVYQDTDSSILLDEDPRPTITVREDDNAPTFTEVPANWSLVPSDLGPGDRFRLLFVSSGQRNSAIVNISSYNTFIQDQAASGHADIQQYSSIFRVVGSTLAVDARDNTATTYTDADKGVPVYWLNGDKVADDYEDFYDGSWSTESTWRAETGQIGELGDDAGNVLTGSDHDGTEAFDGTTSRAFGAPGRFTRLGRPNSSVVGEGPLSSSQNLGNATEFGFYGLSGVFVVEGTASTDATLSALSLSGVTLSPGFAADTLTYTASVDNAVDSTTVTATANDDGATVATLPADADDAMDGHQVALAVGDTTVSVTVTAADGTTMQTYTVTVTRADAAPELAVTITADPTTVNGFGTVQLNATVTGASGAVTYAWRGLGTFSNDGILNPVWTAHLATSNDVVTILELIVVADGLTAFADVTITIRANQAPKVSLEDVPTEVDGGDEVSLTAAVTDPEGDGLTYSWTSSAGGGFDDAAAAGATWTAPDATRQQQPVTLTLTVTDDGAGTRSTTQTLSLTVRANEVPTGSVSAQPETVLGGQEVQLTVSVTDPENDDLTYSWGSSGGGTFDSTAAASYTWTAPDATTADQTVTLTLTVTDKVGDTAFSTDVTVRENQPPEVTLAAIATEVRGGGDVALTATATDPEGDMLTYAWTNDGGSFDDASALNTVWTAPGATDADQTVTLTLTVTDDGAGARSTSVTAVVTVKAQSQLAVTITADPATVDGGGTVQLNSMVTGASGAVTYSWSSGIHGMFSSTSSPNPVWSASSASFNNYEVPIRLLVFDSTVTVDATMIITVRANQAPEVSASANPTSVAGGGPVTLDGTASDPEGDTLTYAWTSNGGGSFDDAGALDTTWTAPDATDADQTVMLTLTATDDGAGTRSASHTVTVTVEAQGNTAPEFSAADATREVPENTAGGENVGAAVTATDADNDTLTYTLEGDDAASFAIVSSSGQITTISAVTYDHEAKSSYSVTVKADDSKGGTDTITVTVNVTDVDEPPSAPAAPSVSAVANSTTSLSVTWTAPDDTGKPDIESYDLQYRQGTSGSWTDGPQDVTFGTVTIGGLAAGTEYQVRVRATNDEGDSDWSTEGTGSTNAPSAPAVDSVAVTSDPGADETYAPGDTIQVTVTFDQAVTVNTSGGTPRIQLRVGGGDPEHMKWADYTGPAATAALLFAYTVQAGDEDTNGIFIAADELELNGGTVQSTEGTDAELAYTEPGTQSGHKVDGVRPTPVLAATSDDGASVIILFSEPLHMTTAQPSAFTLTVDTGTAPAVSSATASGDKVTLGLDSALTSDQAATVTYVDATSGNDAVAVQDAAGNDAANFTTGEGDVPDVANAVGAGCSLADGCHVVPANWGLIPSGLGAGAEFRLLFRSSTTRNAQSANIADYNTFVQDSAAAGHADIQVYSFAFKVLGSTADIDARDNTATTYTAADKGVAIYWLGGAKVADDYEDFYDGSWSNANAGKNELGANRGAPVIAVNVTGTWTGSTSSGTEVIGGGTSFALGQPDVRIGQPLGSNSAITSHDDGPFYGLSPVFRVSAQIDPQLAPTVSTVDITSTPTAATDTYGQGETIRITVTFRQPVTVTGTPRIQLRVGGGNPEHLKWADHESGSGTAALVFAYTVQSGDMDDNGIYIEADELELNGGTIQSGTGITANLDYPLQGQQNDHKVDGSLTPTTNNPPEFAADRDVRLVLENSPAGTSVGDPVTATDADNDTLTYTLEGDDAASFAIDASAGQITTISGVTYDHEAKSSYLVTVKADDGKEGTDTIIIAIGLTDVDEPPSAPAAPTVEAVSGATDNLLVSWTAPDNTGKPDIESYDLQYRQGTSGSFTDGPQDETGLSATITGLAAGTAYQVRVRATNDEGDSVWSSAGSGTTNAQAVTLAVTITADPTTVNGGGMVQLSTTVTGASGNVSYSWSATTGTFSNASTHNPVWTAPDALDIARIWKLNLTVSDSAASETADVRITVRGNQAPEVSASANPTSVAGGGTVTLDGTASDPEGDTLTYAWTSNGGGTFDDAGALDTTWTAPAATDAAQTIMLTLTVTDDGAGTRSASHAVTVTVEAQPNAAPSFTSAADFTADENRTAVGTVIATDADAGDAVTYAVTGGADIAHFLIGPDSGVLIFAAEPDHEDPADADTNNVYQVTVTATGGTGARELTVTQDITVTVNDVDETPAVTDVDVTSTPTAAADTYGRDETIEVTVTFDQAVTVTGTPRIQLRIGGGDPQHLKWADYAGGTGTTELVFAYTVQAGDQDDNGIFIEANELFLNSGTIQGVDDDVAATLTYTRQGTESGHKVDGSGCLALPAGRLWSACLTAGEIDSGGRYGYESPSVGSLAPATFDVGATTYTVTRLFDNDQFGGSTFVRISLSPILSEDDARNLTLHLGDDTSLSFGDASYSTGSSFSSHQWSRSDALGWSAGQKIVVGITQDSTPPANAAPVFTSADNFTADENQMAVGTVIATDADAGDTVSYAVTGGADMAHFEIDSSSGVLTFVTAPDHENPADDGTNNVYQVTVTATGGTGARELTATQDITVTVTDVDETPAVASVDVTSTPSATADTYGLDETIEVTVTFDQAVTVNTSGGTPSIEFEVGGNQPQHLKLATYADGSGTTTLRFDYVVQSGDMDDNGIWLKANKLGLNGGTIQGVDDDVAANLDYSSLGRQDDHKVDGSLTTTPAGCGTLPTGRLWSACMTVGTLTVAGLTFLGWHDGGSYTGSSLTDEDFDYGSDTYNLDTISLVGGGLTITFDDPGAGDLATQATRDKLTLHVGDTDTFNLGDGTLNAAQTGVSWTSTGLTWTAGDAVALSISVPAPPTPVPTTWSLVPSGLGDGDSFRLLFIGSSSRDASDSDIAVYNTFIQNLAAAGHADIQAHSATFRVLGSTEAVDARDNTGTTGTGVRIYWLNGAKVADDYADFYDGDWDEEREIARETGALVSISANWKIWTGSAEDGTEWMHTDGTSRALGNSAANNLASVMQGSPNSSNSAYGPIESDTANRTTDRGLYGLSGVFTVDASLDPVNTPPTFQQENTTREVEENSPAGTAVGDPVTATDADDDTLTYTLEGTDAASFGIDSASGQIQTKSGITYDYETKEEYSVTVKADDGNGGTDTIAVAIDLLDVDETVAPPAVTDVDVTSTPTATADTYGWNETIEVTVTFDQAVRVTGTPRILLRIGGGQPQHRKWANYAGGTGTTALVFTYVVQAGDMDDDGIYIEANELVLNGGTILSVDDDVAAVLDYARLGTQSEHKVNGSLTTIVPGTPTALTANASGQTVVNLSWTAPDGPVTGYRIEYRPEGGSWTDVEADTGSPATTYRHQELDPGTTYEYRVSAINPAGTGTASGTASATTDEQGSPVFTSGAAFSVEENETAVGTVTAADPDPEDTVRYAITGGDDREHFRIDPNSGALTFTVSPDYESPADADEDNAYQVTVAATGGTGNRALTANQAITVTVTGVNEPPGKPVGPWASWLVDNPDTLSVRWYAPHWWDKSESFGKPPITSYEVRYQKGDIDDWGKWEKWEEWTYWPDAQGIPTVEAAANSAQTEFSVYIDGLEPGATYQLQVRAINDDGAGVWSNRGSNRKPTGPVAEVDVNGDGIVDADPVITLPVGGAATYRVRPGRCEGYKSLNAQALRGTTENAPQHIPVDVSPADVYMTCAGEDDPGEWQEITLTGPSDELLSTSFEASVLHTVMYQQRSHESWTFLMSWGHLVTAEVPAPETMAPVGSLTVTAEEGRDRPHVTWNAVSGAPYYQVQWRWGPDEEWGPFQSQGGATYTRQKETEETAYTIPISGTVPTVNDVKRTQDVMVRVRPFDYDSLAVGPWREVTLPGRAVRPPTIIGTARVGETLTADTSPITRESAALANAAFSYQWLRTGGAYGYHDIPGATGSTYTLTPYDEVRRIKVRVTFTNEEGEEETQTSSVTAKVAPADADESEVALPASAAVLAGFSLVDAGASPQTLLAQPMDGASVEVANPDGGSYAIRADLNEGHTAGSVALELTGRKSASTTEGVMPYSLYGDDGAGALRGEALPAGSYVLTMTAYEGSGGGGAVLHTLEVSFTVTAAAEEPGTGQEDEEEENTAPLTARFLHEEPLGYHSGAGTTLTVRLSFSEAVSITPEALEQALAATNATVEAVSRVDGRSDLWEVRLTPHSDATVTLLLPLAADCDAAGAVCTGDGRAPAHAIGTAIPGPLPNSQATGAPTIDGVAEVGQVLSADVTGIDDDNAAFSYQWLRSDGGDYTDIEDATGSTYTLVADDQGKTIKVKVSFTDDEGNPESLTSDPTGEVEAAETVPGRPQDLEGEASAQGIALTWNAPVDSSVTSYVIYRAVLDQGQLHGKPMTKHATIDATGAEMAYTDDEAEAGVEYRYRVAAVNSAGEGKKSTWINIFAEDS